MPRSESWVIYEILKAWGSHPQVRLWRANTGVAQMGDRAVRFGIPGQADLTGIIGSVDAPGVRLEIECKSETGQQRPEQAAFQAMIERFGGIYCLARSVEDVDRALNLYGLTRD